MGRKRDRWDSSSDEEDAKQTLSVKKASKAQSKKKAATEPKLPLHNPLLQGCRSVYDTYEQVDRLSEGTYGIVWKARDLATNETVALKQIKFNVDDPNPTENTTRQRNGFPVTALREISVLLALSAHEAVVSVREMVVGRAVDQVFMVMELLDRDLSQTLSAHKEPLQPSELKSITHQILSGVQNMHSHWFLHRDLKPSNLLVHRYCGLSPTSFSEKGNDSYHIVHKRPE